MAHIITAVGRGEEFVIGQGEAQSFSRQIEAHWKNLSIDLVKSLVQQVLISLALGDENDVPRGGIAALGMISW